MAKKTPRRHLKPSIQWSETHKVKQYVRKPLNTPPGAAKSTATRQAEESRAKLEARSRKPGFGKPQA